MRQRFSSVIIAAILITAGVLFIGPPAVYAQDVRVVINTGHTGRVNTIAYHDSYSLLFSGGEDGTLRIWDPETEKLVYLLQITHNPIEKLILNPEAPQVGIIEKDGIGTHRLSVWNWQTKSEIFSRQLGELPLDIAYSPLGSFIVYSVTDYDSLTFIDSSTGRTLNYLSEGFGIVTSFVVSPSENTLMAYLPSGRIEYWRIREGERKTWVETERDVRSIYYTRNLRFMIGSTENRLVIIDLLTGKVDSFLELDNVRTVTANPRTNEIVAVHGPAGSTVSTVKVSGAGLRSRKIASVPGIYPAECIYRNDQVYLPGEDGRIFTLSSSWNPDRLSADDYIINNLLVDITSVDFHENRMVITTDERILFLSSDFFTETRSRFVPEYFDVRIFDNPLPGTARVITVSDGRFLLYSNTPRGCSLSFIDPETGELDRETLELDSPVAIIDTHGERILTYQENGTLTLFDADRLDPVFEYSAFGIESAVLTDTGIILGKSRSTGFNSPLIEIDPETGETVPIFDNSLIIYEIEYDFENREFYTLGIENKRGTTATTFKTFSGRGFSNVHTLFTFLGEDTNATLTVDPRGSTVYTSLGYEGIKYFSPGNFRVLDQKEHIPRTIRSHKSFLYAVNQDHSISVWNLRTKEKVMDLYFFGDSGFNWIALLASGRYYASEGADEYIAVYRRMTSSPGLKQRYKLDN
jgi:WD40 repeat protein